MSFTPIKGPLRYIGEGYSADHESQPAYQTYPLSTALGQLPPPAPLAPVGSGFSLARINMRQVMIGVVVIVIVALIMRQLMKLAKNTSKVERNAVVSRLSTKELAQRLYDRLDAKGSKTSGGTMRSLERLAR